MDVQLLKSADFFGVLLSFLALAVSLWCLWQFRRTNALKRSFFAGKNGGDLEEVILILKQKLNSLEQETLFNSRAIKDVQESLSFAVQKIGIVRYSPFAESGGGNYSFSLALLDAHNTGVVLTNMYGRQQSRIYTKKIVKGKCEISLTEEEMRAILLANNRLN